MLILTRKTNEAIIIGKNIVIKVLDARGKYVRLGIEAPREIPVHRDNQKKIVAKQDT